MESYLGKICPFCKTDIRFGERVKVCSSCGIPHHVGCWNQNHGCTTFGCSEQNQTDMNNTLYGNVTVPNSIERCARCGAELEGGHEFCAKCGTPRASKNKICSKCGTELKDDQAFCPKCGQKADLTINAGVSAAIAQFNSDLDTTKKKSKKKPIIIGLSMLAVVAIVVVCVLVFVPKLTVSVEELCAQGKYTEAYDKADASEKMNIKAESIAAERCAYSADNLKDPSSFKLRDIYYLTNDNGEIIFLVLYISGANSYGANVSSYWLYDWSDEKQIFGYVCSVSSLTDEEYSKYDSEEETMEKLTNNVGRVAIKKAIQDGIHLDKTAVKRINDLYESGKLDSVEPINRNA